MKRGPYGNPSMKPNGEKKRANHYMSSLMEEENDAHILDLEARVQGLKEISIKMREEVTESNTLLDNMNVQFTNVTGMVGNALRRMRVLSSFATGRHLWYMMLFIVGFITFMYLFYRRK